MGSRCVKFGVFALTLSYWSLDVQHGTSWQRTLWDLKNIIVALHKDGEGYKKIAKTLKMRFHSEQASHGRPNPKPSRVISRGCVWEIDVWVLPALLQRLKGWVGDSACQWSDHMPHTASNWSAWLSSQKEASSKDDAQESLQTVCLRQADKGHELLEPCPVVWWDQDKRIWFRWCQACGSETRWGVQRQVCLAYSQAWWWECHGLGLHECCRHWGATVHWGNHELQHVLCHTVIPSETGLQGSIPTL